MPDEDKDMQWNRQHIQGAVQQGILQGDSMDKIADRLMPVVNMDSNAAIRTARTAVTSVENKGRKDATERVKEAGIPMVETWSCTHDSRTRDTHIMLDGTEPNEQGLYGEGILNTPIAYPADPSGDPEEVYNCRCGLISSIKGIDHSKDDELYEQFMEENYYEDWQTVKEQRGEKEEAFQAKREGAAERIEKWRSKQEERIEKIEQEEREKAKEKKEFSNKNSKIKQTLYHGSSKDFEEFQTKHIGENTGNKGLFGEGLYFTQKTDLAESYAEGGYVYSVKVNVENPFNWNSIKTQEQFDEFKKQIGVEGLEWNRYEKQIKVLLDDDTEIAFTKALKSAGYDGVVYKYKDGAKEFVVFDDNQIKIIEKRKV
jgi:hypothetical protein